MDVVVDVVRVQSHSGHLEVPELPGYIVAVCHVNGDQSEFKELGNVEADWDDEGGEDEDQAMPPARKSQTGIPVPQRSGHGYQTLQSDAHQQVALTGH